MPVGMGQRWYLFLFVDDPVEAVLGENGLLGHVVEARLGLVILLLLELALAPFAILVLRLLGDVVLLHQPVRRRLAVTRASPRQ
jgi:hypothetical protein